ncbi:MAG: hypothetical protein QG614_76 [Patescibacteria group bacterium]|nr:hypothetical protein [Patescibacteria group bacterium]
MITRDNKRLRKEVLDLCIRFFTAERGFVSSRGSEVSKELLRDARCKLNKYSIPVMVANSNETVFKALKSFLTYSEFSYCIFFIIKQ